MRISRIYIENFRNFSKLDVSISTHSVIIGENKIGKSNLIYALRLVLDPSLPDSARQLRMEDFWDGLPRPLTTDDRIIISIEVTDFENNENLMAVLSEHLIHSEPMTSRLTYVFQALANLEDAPQKESDYEFFVYGGDNAERRFGYEVRRRIPLDVFPALRDAESDLANWRRSPLRPLLDKAVSEIDRAELDEIGQRVAEATSDIHEISNIKALAELITTRLDDMVGEAQSTEMTLGFSPTEPERLLRSLRLFIDNGTRSIGDASLGSANLIYLILKSLELDQLVQQNKRDHTYLAIEEPEAHLHPHLQRLVYKDFLNPRAHLPGDIENDNRTVLLTTHSPHIVSVSPLNYYVLLKKAVDGSTEAVSTAELELSNKDIDDLQRYLDVTRGEMLFARGILLVEGDAEEFILPTLGKLNDYDFDELGITVCSVSGTNFLPYIKLLGTGALNIPFSLITDFDPLDSGANLGEKRIINLMAELMSQEDFERHDSSELLRRAPRMGLFLGDYTLEVDLFKSGQHRSICKTLLELAESTTVTERAKKWRSSPGEIDEKRLVKDITTIGKGRFAQRLASNLSESNCPNYIKRAIKHVSDKCR